MNLNQINIGQLLNQIIALMAQIVGIGLIVIMFAVISKLFGFQIPHVATPNETALAYLCGAWWLLRKAG